MSKREQIANVYGFDTLNSLVFLAPDYLDEAIIGVGQNDGVLELVYSEPCIIRLIKQHEGRSQDEAVERFNTNFWGLSDVIYVDNEVFE